MHASKVTTKYVRISPRKARLAAQLIRDRYVEDAVLQLRHSNLKAGRLLEKTLKSAVTNAENVGDYRREHLFVEEVRVDEGPRLKRAKPKNRGGRHPIIKRTSHFTITLCAG